MANPLSNQNPRRKSNPLQQLQQLKASGPSSAVFNQMYNSNPNFRQFADKVRNMTPEDAFRQHGMDFNQFKGYKW